MTPAADSAADAPVGRVPGQRAAALGPPGVPAAGDDLGRALPPVPPRVLHQRRAAGTVGPLQVRLVGRGASDGLDPRPAGLHVGALDRVVNRDLLRDQPVQLGGLGLGTPRVAFQLGGAGDDLLAAAGQF
jgi:hypothetical protein